MRRNHCRVPCAVSIWGSSSVCPRPGSRHEPQTRTGPKGKGRVLFPWSPGKSKAAKCSRVMCMRPPSPPRGPDVCALQLSTETPPSPPRVSVWSAWWVDYTAEHRARCRHTAGQAETRNVTSLPRRSALCLFEVVRAGDAHCHEARKCQVRGSSPFSWCPAAWPPRSRVSLPWVSNVQKQPLRNPTALREGQSSLGVRDLDPHFLCCASGFAEMRLKDF